MMPTLRGSNGRPCLSRGTMGMLKLLLWTVCAFSLLGLPLEPPPPGPVIKLPVWDIIGKGACM